jgi:hypothetical protein
MTDQDITIAMAEVDGWKRRKEAPNGRAVDCWDDPSGHCTLNCHSYLTDANACLRVLERRILWACDYEDGVYHVECGTEDGYIQGHAPTFCRAACEAILRAHGKWREEP